MQRDDNMNTNDSIYIDAETVAELLSISKGFSYKLIRQMNCELKNKGFITVAGKIPKKYFEEKCYGYNS